MPLSQLDPVAALIVIDLQKFIVSAPLAHPTREIVSRSAALARAFRARGWPVALVNVTGRPPGRTDATAMQIPTTPGWADLAPELDPQPTDLLLTKQRVGAFHETQLDEYLRGHQVTQVFITGISTSAGVESTARSAFDLGYNVGLVVDAMTDRDLANHRHSIEKVFPRLGEAVSTDDLLSAVLRPTVATT